MKNERLEIQMAKLETRMDEVVIPSLERIEKGVTTLRKDAFKKILINHGRLQELENWKHDLETKTKTSLWIGKKAWILVGGIIGGTITLIKFILDIYEKVK